MRAGAARKRASAEVSRANILAAAGRRFGALGFERTRLEDVAADVGIGRAGVLYHFGSKRELYQAVCDQLFGALYELVLHDLSSDAPAAVRIERSAHTLVDYVVAHPEAAQIAMRTAATADSEEEKDARKRSEPFTKLILSAYAEVFPGGDAAEATLQTSAIVGTVLYYVAGLPTFAGASSQDPLSPENVARLKDLVGGIATRATRAHPNQQ